MVRPIRYQPPHLHFKDFYTPLYIYIYIYIYILRESILFEFHSFYYYRRLSSDCKIPIEEERK